MGFPESTPNTNTGQNYLKSWYHHKKEIFQQEDKNNDKKCMIRKQNDKKTIL